MYFCGSVSPRKLTVPLSGSHLQAQVVQTDHRFAQGGFAGARLTNQADNLSLANGQANVVHRVHALMATDVEVFDQMIDDDEIVHEANKPG